MLSSGNAVLLSRVLIPLLGLVTWIFLYLDARCAYIDFRGVGSGLDINSHWFSGLWVFLSCKSI
jgi:hypothetical protein